jgi:hypothetical protein
MLIPQNEGYDMQLIGIAIRWKTAFHPEGTLLLQGDVLQSLPSLSLHRVAQGTYHLATGAPAMPRSISMYLSNVPRERADPSHSYTGTSLRPSSRLDYPISTRVPGETVRKTSRIG